MLTIIMILVWSGLGALGLLLLSGATLEDEMQAEEDSEHDISDRRE